MLTTWVSSFFAWLYIVARIVLNQVDVYTPFLDRVPSVSLSAMGSFSFALTGFSMFVYLWLWGRFDRGALAQRSWQEREP